MKTYKTYKTMKDCKINDNFTVPKGSILKIDWDAYDAAVAEDEYGNQFNWFDTDVVEVN